MTMGPMRRTVLDITALPASSDVVMDSASKCLGGAMESLTAWIRQTKEIAVSVTIGIALN